MSLKCTWDEKDIRCTTDDNGSVFDSRSYYSSLECVGAQHAEPLSLLHAQWPDLVVGIIVMLQVVAVAMMLAMLTLVVAVVGIAAIPVVRCEVVAQLMPEIPPAVIVIVLTAMRVVMRVVVAPVVVIG